MAASDQNGKNPGYRSFDGADGEVRIPDGKWHITPNARFEHLLKSGLSGRALRVYAYLQLKSMNRRGELCAHDLQGEQPVTIDEIATAADLDKADAGRCLDELDNAGLGERRPAKDGTRRKLIYSYAEPRAPKPEREMVRAPFLPEWFPDHLPSLRAYLIRRRFKDFPQDENGTRTLFLEKCEKGARLLDELDELFAREEDSAGAHPALYKEDRTTDKAQTQPAAAAVVESAAAAGSTPEEPTAEDPAPPPAVPLVSKELSIDEDAAERLVSGCREVDKSITGPEIVMLARAKLLDARDQIRTGKIANVVGLLISHIPKMCKGATLQSARQQIEAEKQKREQRLAYVREMWHELTEEDRTRLLPEYPELAELAP